LRLFAIEILFKIRSTLFFKGATSLKSNSFTSEEAESTNTGLHSVIVTASPVLTNEIRRFY
jgi:flagellar motor protein MotB